LVWFGCRLALGHNIQVPDQGLVALHVRNELVTLNVGFLSVHEGFRGVSSATRSLLINSAIPVRNQEIVELQDRQVAINHGAGGGAVMAPPNHPWTSTHPRRFFEAPDPEKGPSHGELRKQTRTCSNPKPRFKAQFSAFRHSASPRHGGTSSWPRCGALLHPTAAAPAAHDPSLIHHLSLMSTFWSVNAGFAVSTY
jgi:hypothetical protein